MLFNTFQIIINKHVDETVVAGQSNSSDSAPSLILILILQNKIVSKRSASSLGHSHHVKNFILP